MYDFWKVNIELRVKKDSGSDFQQIKEGGVKKQTNKPEMFIMYK